MRKVVLAAAASLLVMSACGGNKSSSSAPTVSTVTSDSSAPADPAPTTTPVPKPTVKIPSELPTTLKITDLTIGNGDKAANGDTVVVRYVGVRSRDAKEFDSNYGGDPFTVDLGTGGVIKGWDQGLVGVQAGGQRQLDVPSDLAYGAQSQGEIIGPNEALSFVIDVLAVIHPADPKNEPVLVIKPTKVTSVVVDDLVMGTGAAAKAGMTVIFNYVFYRGDNGAKLFSSWSSTPATVQLIKGAGGDSSLDGLIEGLIGSQVGGRLQITVPAAEAFGGQGDSGLGLPVGSDVVMVADILAVY